MLYGTDRPGAGGEHIWASNESLCALSVGADVVCDTVNQTAGSMKIPPTTPRALCQQVGLARFWFFALFCSFWRLEKSQTKPTSFDKEGSRVSAVVLVNMEIPASLVLYL